MNIEPSVLVNSLQNEFDDWIIHYTDDGTVIVTQSFTPGMFVKGFENFKQNVQEFLFQYTNCWEGEKFVKNRVEGYYRAEITCE
jgi:hypothetical protein